MHTNKHKRAITEEEKRHVIGRLTEAWIDSPADMRLGQLLLNSHVGGDIFYTECYDLLDEVEVFVYHDKLDEYDVYDIIEETVVFSGPQFKCERFIGDMKNEGLHLVLRKVD